MVATSEVAPAAVTETVATVAIGRADNKLAVEFRRFMKDMLTPGRLGENDNAEKWSELDDPDLDMAMCGK